MRLHPWMTVVCVVAGCCHDLPSASSRLSANMTNQSFSQAKKHLADVYVDHRESLYCGCRFGEHKTVDPNDCGYVPMGKGNRTRRIEWEHVVPAQAFGHSYPEWRDGHPDCVDSKGKAFRGRSCARKVAIGFRYMEADMYNLYPAIGELNERRGHLSMGMVDGEDRAFGRCDFEIAAGKVEPRTEVRGDIARTYLYMDAAYPGRSIVSPESRVLFEAWSEEDPVDLWECERGRRIAALQANVNWFVEDDCRAGGL